MAGRAPRVPRSRPAAAACGRAASHARATAGFPQAVAPSCAALSLVFRLEASSFESPVVRPVIRGGSSGGAAPQGVERARGTKLVELRIGTTRRRLSRSDRSPSSRGEDDEVAYRVQRRRASKPPSSRKHGPPIYAAYASARAPPYRPPRPPRDSRRCVLLRVRRRQVRDR
jgi:hypothetical protein